MIVHVVQFARKSLTSDRIDRGEANARHKITRRLLLMVSGVDDSEKVSVNGRVAPQSRHFVRTHAPSLLIGSGK